MQTRIGMMNKHLMKHLQHGLTGMCLVVLASGAAQATDDIPVEARGLGLTEEQATKRALLSAVEQAVGVLTYSRNVIRNEEVVVDEINNLSNGFVKSFKKLEAGKDTDGNWSVTVSAVVHSGNVADFLKRAGVETKVDLTNDWAQLTTGIKAKRDALALYEAKIPAIKNRLYTVELVDLKTGKPVTGLARPYIEEDLDGNATCAWVYRVTPDIKFWKECAYPLLDACFKALAVGHKTILVTYGEHKPHSNDPLMKKKPQFVPYLKDVYAPRSSISQNKNPGLHPQLFGMAPENLRRPYQGELKFNGIAKLYAVILENPTSSLHSSVTMFYFTHDVFQRLFGLVGSYGELKSSEASLWSLIGKVESSDGSKYVTTTKDRNGNTFRAGMIGHPLRVFFNKHSSLYFGPWFQLPKGGAKRSGLSSWPDWVNLSCFTRFDSVYGNGKNKCDWATVVLHEGKPYPMKVANTNDYAFAEWLYLPVVVTIPIDTLPKINQLSATLSAE
jgi:hypothetical protein